MNGEKLIQALKEELERQWEYNHFEHCGRLPHKGSCHWPRPKVLDVQVGDPIPVEDDRLYMRGMEQ